MSQDSIWGVFLIIYIVAFALWQMVNYENIEINKKIYIKREDESARERFVDMISFIWILGLIATLTAWYFLPNYPYPFIFFLTFIMVLISYFWKRIIK